MKEEIQKCLKLGVLFTYSWQLFSYSRFVHSLIDIDALVRFIWFIGQDLGHINLKLDILIVNFS